MQGLTELMLSLGAGAGGEVIFELVCRRSLDWQRDDEEGEWKRHIGTTLAIGILGLLLMAGSGYLTERGLAWAKLWADWGSSFATGMIYMKTAWEVNWAAKELAKLE